jgi:uncharacterized membrane protein
VGFIVAFFVIAVYWTAHHRVFRFVHAYTPGLIWLNVVFLFSIVLMPFTAAFQGEYPGLKTPWILYASCVVFSGLMQARLQTYIRNPANGLTPSRLSTHPDLDPVRPMVAVVAFLISIIVMLAGFIWAARFMLMLIFPMITLYTRLRYRRLLREYEQRQAVIA